MHEAGALACVSRVRRNLCRSRWTSQPEVYAAANRSCRFPWSSTNYNTTADPACDVLIPAALENQITEECESDQASTEAANGPVNDSRPNVGGKV